MGELVELSQSQARALLAERDTGRLALVAPDGPHIIPVNYALVDEDIIIRTGAFSLLALHGRQARVAFEVDHTDDVTRTGWSVLARGSTRPVLDADQLAHIRRVWEPMPWADGVRNLHLRITITHLTGRRVGTLPVG